MAMEALEQEYQNAKTQREKVEAITKQLRLGVSQEKIKLTQVLQGVQEALVGSEEAALFKRVVDLVSLEQLTLDLQLGFKELEAKVGVYSSNEASQLLSQVLSNQNEIKQVLSNLVGLKMQVLRDEQQMIKELRAYLARH